MTNATETKTTRIASGLIERAQQRAGVVSDEAFARLINVSNSELDSMRQGGAASIRGMVGLAVAFGTPLSEIVARRNAEAVAA